jgi:hypothetical protein
METLRGEDFHRLIEDFGAAKLELLDLPLQFPGRVHELPERTFIITNWRSMMREARLIVKVFFEKGRDIHSRPNCPETLLISSRQNRSDPSAWAA